MTRLQRIQRARARLQWIQSLLPFVTLGATLATVLILAYTLWVTR